MNMDDDVQQPTPQDYGFPANPSTVNKQCWVRQEAFLLAYAKLGTILHGAETVGIHRDTVNKWVSADLYSFKKRMDLAHDDYCDWIQGIIRDRISNPQGNRGSDVLVMFAAKAEMPEKYREEVKVLGVSAPLQMLDKLRELAAKERKARELEASVIEGEFTEIGAPAPHSEKSTPVSDRSDLPRGGSASCPENVGRPTNQVSGRPDASPPPAKKAKKEPGRVKRR